MLNLSLIPQEARMAIKLKRIYQLTKRISILLILITLFVAITLLSAKIILQNNFNKVVAETTLVTKNYQSNNNRVREINSQLDNIQKIQKDFFPWSLFLKNLAEITPEDINYENISFNLNDQNLKIKGEAKTRDGLLILKDNLSDSGIYSIIDFPIKNILTKENISFSIDVKINLDQAETIITKEQ
jgi:hypothetical protein